MDILLLVISYLIMFIGVAGCILPLLPGTPVVFLGIFIYAWKTGFSVVSPTLIFILLSIAVLTVILDYIAGSIGSGKMGASRWGIGGAFLGAIVGILFSPWGVILGPPIGALVGELLTGKNLRDATRASGGAILGVLGGALTKIVASFIMIGLFTARVF